MSSIKLAPAKCLIGQTTFRWPISFQVVPPSPKVHVWSLYQIYLEFTV